MLEASATGLTSAGGRKEEEGIKCQAKAREKEEEDESSEFFFAFAPTSLRMDLLAIHHDSRGPRCSIRSSESAS